MIGCRAAHFMMSFIVQSSHSDLMPEASLVASSANSCFSRSSLHMRRRSSASLSRFRRSSLSCTSRSSRLCLSSSLCLRSLSLRTASLSLRSASLCRRRASSSFVAVRALLLSLLLCASRDRERPAPDADLPLSLSLLLGSVPRGEDLLRSTMIPAGDSPLGLICPASTELLRDLGGKELLDSFCCSLNSLQIPGQRLLPR